MYPVIYQELIANELRWMLSYKASNGDLVYLTLESRAETNARWEAARLLEIEIMAVSIGFKAINGMVVCPGS